MFACAVLVVDGVDAAGRAGDVAPAAVLAFVAQVLGVLFIEQDDDVVAPGFDDGGESADLSYLVDVPGFVGQRL